MTKRATLPTTRQPIARMMGLERRLRDAGIILAARVLPAHEAAEMLHGLADDVAAIRDSMITSATHTQRHYRRHDDA